MDEDSMDRAGDEVGSDSGITDWSEDNSDTTGGAATTGVSGSTIKRPGSATCSQGIRDGNVADSVRGSSAELPECAESETDSDIKRLGRTDARVGSLCVETQSGSSSGNRSNGVCDSTTTASPPDFKSESEEASADRVGTAGGAGSSLVIDTSIAPMGGTEAGAAG